MHKDQRIIDSAVTAAMGPSNRRVADLEGPSDPAPVLTFKSTEDSLSWARAKAAADNAKGLHITVSLKERRIWVITGGDTLMTAPAAVAKGQTLEIQGHRWTFVMPRGVRTVRGKQADPVWVPPDWLYAEAAADNGLTFAPMNGTVKLADGRRLAVRDQMVGVISVNGEWEPLPVDEHIVFNDTLYIPPEGTINRHVEGQLGKYRLDLGDGFLLHGTPYQASVGQAATHGCVRLHDDDIQWLYENIPVGTKVYIY
jgi:hypothetical protein